MEKNVKVNTIETRISAIKKRHKLNISTTTTGFPKQEPSTTPKKTLKAPESPQGTPARPVRTPKPSAEKRQTDEDEDGRYDDEESTTTMTPTNKRFKPEMEVYGQDDAAWHALTNGQYDGVYMLDGARGLGL